MLELFDYVIASVHGGPGDSGITRRLVKAIENPYTTILGHPTGRILLEREGYDVDLNQVIDAAAANGVMLEINAHPARLDLDWRYVRAARDKDVRLIINPDAHSVTGLDHYRYGVGVARKGWLSATDVVNTLGTSKLRELLQSLRKV